MDMHVAKGYLIAMVTYLAFLHEFAAMFVHFFYIGLVLQDIFVEVLKYVK